MSNFEKAIDQANTIERCAYLTGYVNAMYTLGAITDTEYTTLFKLIQEKRRGLI